MKITELHVEGFRSLHDVTWRQGDLNVVIGPNAGGKSNLLKALDMLSASARGELADYVRHEGGMGAVLWDGQARRVNLRVTAAWQDADNKSPGIAPGQEFNYVLKLPRLGASSGYQIEVESLSTSHPSGATPAGGLLARHGNHIDPGPT